MTTPPPPPPPPTTLEELRAMILQLADSISETHEALVCNSKAIADIVDQLHSARECHEQVGARVAIMLEEVLETHEAVRQLGTRAERESARRVLLEEQLEDLRMTVRVLPCRPKAQDNGGAE